jgi:uncharacterized protein
VTDQQPESTTPQDGGFDAGSSAPPPPPPPPAAPPAAAPTPEGSVPPPPSAYGQPQPGSSTGGAPTGAGVQAPLSQSDERMWAMLGHLGGIVLGFIAPLITWLVFRERSAFVEDQGKEALNFQITVLIGYVVAAVLSGILIGLVLFPIVWIASLVLCIMAGMAANKGERYRYPFALRLIK